MANNFSALCWPIMAILVASGMLHLTTGTPVPDPKPQLLPGQIPSHIASHPALSSVAQGKESALYQFAYNTANRRGPSPSPLVLQNNQERNLHLANQFAQQRSGQPYLSNPVNTGVNGHSHGAGGNQNPEVRALEELQRIKQGATTGPNQIPQGANQYQPQPFTNGGFQQQQQLQGGHHHGHPGQGHLHSHGDDDEREDIKKLKALLNLPRGPLPNNGGTLGSPTIGVAGERGILNPTQFPQNHQQQQPFHNHGHDHSHSHNPSSTPFPVTAQSQNALGSLQFGHGTGRPYPGQYSGPTGSPHLNGPYGHRGSYPVDSQYAEGQDAKTLIKSVETSSEAYQNLVYIDPIREPTSINKHIPAGQSVFVLPASDYKSDDYQRLLNRPAEILIDVLPADGNQQGKDFELHNFSLMLSPSTYARCAQATHKRGYGGKCKLILKVEKKSGTYPTPTPVTVSY